MFRFETSESDQKSSDSIWASKEELQYMNVCIDWYWHYWLALVCFLFSNRHHRFSLWCFSLHDLRE